MNTTNLVEAWTSQGACVGASESFFDLRETYKARLREICASCKVHAECLDYALFSPQSHGMWAGTTPSERKAILKASTDPRAVKARQASME